MSTFVWITVYAVLVLGGLIALSAGFVLLGRWLIARTHDPDAEAH